MRIDTLDEFRVWLRSVNTDPDIEQLLYTGILSWLTIGSTPFNIETSVQPILVIAFRAQLLLGWEALLYGFVVSSIIIHQHSYYTDRGSRKIGNRWRLELISHMWTIIQNHWIHRNHTLQDTEAHARLSGLEELETAVRKKYELGIGDLPSVYT